MSKPWNGLVKLIELKVVDINGNVLFKKENINNVLHYQGQSLILQCMFGTESVPGDYYVGLDSRSSITLNDKMTNLQLEPSGFGYSRQTLVRGTTNLNVSPDTTPPKVTSSTITFSAVGGSYTATDMFLCTAQSGTSGYLISTVAFGTTITVSPENLVSMKFAMILNGC